MPDWQTSIVLKGQGNRGRHIDSPEWGKIYAGLHPGQQSVVADARQGVVDRKGRGTGKSHAAAAWFHRPWATHPGLSSVCVTISGDRTRDIMLPAFWKLNEQHQLGLNYSAKHNAMVWPNGYKVLFRGCKDRNEANK